MCIMMARLRPMTFSPTGMPACLRASSRQSNAARSCAKHDPERNVLGCSQTLKNDTLTHPSLWADHSFFTQPHALASSEEKAHASFYWQPDRINHDPHAGYEIRIAESAGGDM